MDFHYPGKGVSVGAIPKVISKASGLEDVSQSSQTELGYRVKCSMHTDQPCTLQSTEFTYLNYGLIVYGKAAFAFKYLEKYLGKTEFDRIMQTYFDEWQFRHPQPEDVRQIFDRECDKDLSWFWDEVLGSSNKMDYAIKSVDDRSVTVVNKGDIESPFPISTYVDGKLTGQQWFDGFSGSKTVTLNSDPGEEIKLDGSRETIDYNRKNNNYKFNGLFKKGDPLQIGVVGGLNRAEANNIFLSLMSGFNYWDGYQLGLALHNGLVPSKKFEFFVAPKYGFKSKELIGLSRFNYYFYPKSGPILYIKPGIAMRSYHEGIGSTYVQEFKFRSIILEKEINNCVANGDTICGSTLLFTEGYNINELTYRFENERMINPYGYGASVELGPGFVKTSLEGQYRLTYLNKKSGLTARLYASAFPVMDETVENGYAKHSLGYKSKLNFYDYKYDHFVLARNKSTNTENFNLLDGQTTQNPVGFNSNTKLGANQNWIGGLNLKADVPVVPVYGYFNFAMFDQSAISEQGTGTAFELGAALSLIPEILEIYFPFSYSENLRNDLITIDGKDKYWERITFLLNVNKLDLFERYRNTKILN